MRRRLGPAALSAIAVVVGWVGVYFAFQGSWLGVILPLVTTALTWTAVRRGERLGRERSGHLAATLLAGTRRISAGDAG